MDTVVRLQEKFQIFCTKVHVFRVRTHTAFRHGTFWDVEKRWHSFVVWSTEICVVACVCNRFIMLAASTCPGDCAGATHYLETRKIICHLLSKAASFKCLKKTVPSTNKTVVLFWIAILYYGSRIWNSLPKHCKYSSKTKRKKFHGTRWKTVGKFL